MGERRNKLRLLGTTSGAWRPRPPEAFFVSLSVSWVLLLSFVRLWYLSLFRRGEGVSYENSGAFLGMCLDDSAGGAGLAEFKLHAGVGAAEGGRVTAI